MTDYSSSEIVDMIIEYGRANKNYRQCAHQYALQYPDRQYPNHTSIVRLINRACESKLCRKRKKKSLTGVNYLNSCFRMVIINPQIGPTYNQPRTQCFSTIQQILSE